MKEMTLKEYVIQEMNKMLEADGVRIVEPKPINVNPKHSPASCIPGKLVLVKKED